MAETMLNDEKLDEQADKIIAYGVKKEIERLSGKYKPEWLKTILNNKVHLDFNTHELLQMTDNEFRVFVSIFGDLMQKHKNSANKTAVSGCHKPNGSKVMQ